MIYGGFHMFYTDVFPLRLAVNNRQQTINLDQFSV